MPMEAIGDEDGNNGNRPVVEDEDSRNDGDSASTASEMARLIQAHYSNEDQIAEARIGGGASGASTPMVTPEATEITLTTAKETNAFLSPSSGIKRNHGMSDEEKIKAQEDITARMDQPAMAREMRYLARDRDESSPGRTLRERSRERSVSVGVDEAALVNSLRELVTEQIRSLSSSTTHEDEGEPGEALHRDMDASFNAFKTGVEGILTVADKMSRGSKLHNHLRISVGALIERLTNAFDLEMPTREGVADGIDETEAESDISLNQSRDSPSSTPGASAASVASEFAASLPDDPAAQIEAFRIILNQLKLRNRRFSDHSHQH